MQASTRHKETLQLVDTTRLLYLSAILDRVVLTKVAKRLAGLKRWHPVTIQNRRFALHGMNGRVIHRLLARMTDYVETRSGLASRYAEYMTTGKKRYEIEHIWENHPERHKDEIAHPSDFAATRNRIGGLLLLARSLHPTCYENNPGFLRFVQASGVPFKPMTSFKSTEMKERCDLYLKLAEHIWNPNRVMEAATS
jgi:hypothetical protein